jgi:hypothetical protein
MMRTAMDVNRQARLKKVWMTDSTVHVDGHDTDIHSRIVDINNYAIIRFTHYLAETSIGDCGIRGHRFWIIRHCHGEKIPYVKVTYVQAAACNIGIIP